MKTIWDILNIPETVDKDIIRTAYSNLSKQCHPEEHPEEFKELQQAYKRAIAYAKSTKKSQNSQDQNIDMDSHLESQIESSTNLHTEVENKIHINYTSVSQKSPKPLYHIDTLIRSTNNEFSQEELDLHQDSGKCINYLNRTSKHRLNKLTSRLKRVASNRVLRNNEKAWGLVFSHTYQKDDLYSIVFLKSVLDTLETYTGFSAEVYRLFEKHLFEATSCEPEMANIQKRLHELENHSTPATLSRKWLTKSQTSYITDPEYKKYHLYIDRFFHNQIFIVFFVFFVTGLSINLLSLITISNRPSVKNESTKSVETKYSNNIDAQYPKATQFDPDSIYFTIKEINDNKSSSINLSKLKQYTETTPFKTRINSDSYPDVIYYDSEHMNIMVKLYDPDTDTLIPSGSALDYLPKHMDQYRAFQYFFDKCKD